MLQIEKTIFVLVDVQDRLAQVMHDKEDLFASLQRLIKGLTVLGIPILWMEQVPEKMGKTIPELADLLSGCTPMAKTSFSCWGDSTFRETFLSHGRNQVLIAGIESHVCVYQTASDLLAEGCEVEVVADAISSRTKQNRDIGLAQMKAMGARITSVEMVLFELMRSVKHTGFRNILRIVK